MPRHVLFSYGGTVLLSFLVLFVGSPTWAQNTTRCETAVNITTWVLEQAYDNPTVQDLLGEAEVAYEESQPLTTDLIQAMPQLDWVAFQVQALLGGAVFGAAEPGEVFYVLNSLNESSKLGNVSKFQGNELEVYDIWRNGWVDMADGLILKAQGLSDEEAKASLYYRAAQYYFVSQWPFPVSEQGLEAQRQGLEAFKQYLSMLEKSRGYHVEWLSIPYSNGTTEANLPAVFVTPDPTKKLPLVILNTGTDYPIEAIFPFGGSQSLENGYAVLAFEGPGQGSVKRYPPYMPLVTRWDTVINEIVSTAENDESISKYISQDKFLWGVSLGGYLAGQACSMLPKDTLVGCIITPAVVSMIPPYAGRFIDTLFLPFNQLNSSEIPEGYGGAFENATTVVDMILRPLLQDCDADSGAPEIWYNLFEGADLVNVLPDYVYNIIDYAGVFTSNVTDIIQTTWLGYKNAFDFVNPNITKTGTPVLVLSGTEDNLMGGQELSYFDQLPDDIKSKSQLVNFTAETGGALHSQSGAMNVQAAAVFPWMKQQLSSSSTTPTSSSSSSSSSSFVGPDTFLFMTILCYIMTP